MILDKSACMSMSIDLTSIKLPRRASFGHPSDAGRARGGHASDPQFKTEVSEDKVVKPLTRKPNVYWHGQRFIQYHVTVAYSAKLSHRFLATLPSRVVQI